MQRQIKENITQLASVFNKRQQRNLTKNMATSEVIRTGMRKIQLANRKTNM